MRASRADGSSTLRPRWSESTLLPSFASAVYFIWMGQSGKHGCLGQGIRASLLVFPRFCFLLWSLPASFYLFSLSIFLSFRLPVSCSCHHFCISVFAHGCLVFFCSVSFYSLLPICVAIYHLLSFAWSDLLFLFLIPDFQISSIKAFTICSFLLHAKLHHVHM